MIPVRMNIQRICFLRAVRMTTPMAQRRKPSSGQKNRRAEAETDWPLSSIHTEAYEAAEASEIATTLAMAVPLAHEGIGEFLRVSRQSTQVCVMTIPMTARTKRATLPLKSAQ